MKIVTNIYEANCITHSGTMHTDDIFSTAFLDLYLGDIKVARTTQIPTDLEKSVIVYDVGRGKFDHHQENSKKRENGITYCAFGLLWQEFGRELLKKKNIENIEEVFTLIDKELVEAIDADDNGVFPKIEAPYKVKTLSEVFKLFNPGYKSNQNETYQFEKAVSFAKEIIEEMIINATGKSIAKKQVLNKIKEKQNHTLFLDEYMPYEQVLLQEEDASDIFFVVYPSNRGGYCVKTIPISSENHNKRLDFPEEWAGLENKELEEKSGIKGLIFCHLTRFLITCDTIETAQLAIEKTLQNQTEKEIILDKNS